MVLRSQSVGEQDVADQQGAFSRAEAPSPAAAGEGASGVRAGRPSALRRAPFAQHSSRLISR